MKWKDLEIEQKKDLEYKINVAISVIDQAFKVSRRPALAYSGGEDIAIKGEITR